MTELVRHPLPSNLIHDLRTPLSQIIGYAEMLTEQAEESGNDGFVRELPKIRAAGYRLLNLINDNFQSVQAAVTPAAVGAATGGPPTSTDHDPAAGNAATGILTT